MSVAAGVWWTILHMWWWEIELGTFSSGLILSYLWVPLFFQVIRKWRTKRRSIFKIWTTNGHRLGMEFLKFPLPSPFHRLFLKFLILCFVYFVYWVFSPSSLPIYRFYFFSIYSDMFDFLGSFGFVSFLCFISNLCLKKFHLNSHLFFLIVWHVTLFNSDFTIVLIWKSFSWDVIYVQNMKILSLAYS